MRAGQARRLQELSCDEACARVLPDYAAELGKPILSLSRHPGRDGSLFVIRFAAAQNQPNAGDTPDSPPIRFEQPRTVDEVLEERSDIGPIPGFGDSLSMEEANEIYRSLRLYVALLERQYDAQEERIIALESQVEALKSAADNR